MRSRLLACTATIAMLTLSPPCAAASPVAAIPADQPANPLLGEWTTPDGVPPYDRIRPEHYEPAFDAALVAARAEYRRIADDPAAPTFANTIEAMEGAGRQLGRISSAYFNVASADATDAIQAIEEQVTPKLTRLSNETFLDQKLFGRVDRIWKARATLGLTPEQARLLEETHENFVRAGAALQPAPRARVAAINEELAKLGVEFGQKLLADQKASDVVLTSDEVAGLPEDQRSAAAIAAKAAGREGSFLFPATRSAAEPFLTASPNRSAREKIWRAFVMRGDNGNMRVTRRTNPCQRR